MNRIVCPHCKKEFELEDTDYLSIVQQVRDEEFRKAVREKEKQLADSRETEIALLREKTTGEWKEKLADKEKKIAELHSELSVSESRLKLAVSEATKEKDKEISELRSSLIEKQAEIANKETEKKLAVTWKTGSSNTRSIGTV